MARKIELCASKHFHFRGSIKENITFGSNDETEDNKNLLNDAIDRAGLKEFIESLPKELRLKWVRKDI